MSEPEKARESGLEHGIKCPDCGGRRWEIALRKPCKSPRHPQETPSLMARLLTCFALLVVGLPLIVAGAYAALETFGAVAAGLALACSSSALILWILVIEGFGVTRKTGALRCQDCGFEQRAPIGHH